MKVTICDISEELLAIFRERARVGGFEPTVHCSEIANFLASHPPGAYDLIVFSSALHHLQNFQGVLSLATKALASNGLLYTNFDPTPVRELSSICRAALKLDYIVFKVTAQTGDLPAATKRNLLRRLRNRREGSPDLELTDENLGVIAEFHIKEGIDDRELVARLHEQGMNAIWHERVAAARYARHAHC